MGANKTAAVLSIKKPGAMTDKGRRDIAAWLRKHASNLVKHGDLYSEQGTFRATFTYLEK